MSVAELDAVRAFAGLSRDTLGRLAEWLECGGRPLADWESRVVRRAYVFAASDDPLDAAAVLLIAGECRGAR